MSNSNLKRGLLEKGPSLSKLNEFKRELNVTYPDTKLVGINGEWYDVSNFINQHPGGLIILDYIDKDVTVLFKMWHKSSVLTQCLESKLIKKTGLKYDLNISPLDKDLLKLHYKLIKDGYYKPDYVLYSKYIFIIVFCFILSHYLVKFSYAHLSMNNNNNNVYMYNSGIFGILMLILLGGLLSTAWQQCGFITHDAMHSIITTNSKWDHIIGLIFGNILFGVNSRHWNNNHNIHHIHTNTIDKNYYVSDPQAYEIAWMQNKHMINLNSKAFNSDNILFNFIQTKIFIPFQAILWIPICAFAGRIAIIFDSIINETNIIHIIAWCFQYIIIYNIYYIHFKSNIDFIIFIGIAAIMAGLTLSLQLLVSHLDKPFNDKDTIINDNEWFRYQANVVKDIKNPISFDWWFGGLNFHLVHHTLPRLPRIYYRKVDPLLKNILKKHNIIIDTKTFFHGIWDITINLSNVANQYINSFN